MAAAPAIFNERIHLVPDGAEKERYRQLAVRAGQSLSEWLREAAQRRAEPIVAVSLD